MIDTDTQPKVLIIRLLEACNAGCFMCSFRFSQDQYRFTARDAEKLQEQLRGSSIQLIRFTGGEPLIHEEIFDIVRVFSSNHLKTSVISNGSRLLESLQKLEEAGLSQLIVSLDSADEKHDRYRQSPGLFRAAVEGLAGIRDLNLKIRTRVNTVAGPHNFAELLALYDLLSQLKVQTWSIIPLKTEKGAWKYNDFEKIQTSHSEFVKHVEEHPGPTLLGYSLHWIGRDRDEVTDYLEGKKNISPRGKCDLVNHVRYYTPKTNEYYTCNCVSHRHDGESLGQQLTKDAFTANGLGKPGRWLNENGPRNCMGCEPVNAALGEGQIDLLMDLFGY